MRSVTSIPDVSCGLSSINGVHAPHCGRATHLLTDARSRAHGGRLYVWGPPNHSKCESSGLTILTETITPAKVGSWHPHRTSNFAKQSQRGGESGDRFAVQEFQQKSSHVVCRCQKCSGKSASILAARIPENYNKYRSQQEERYKVKAKSLVESRQQSGRTCLISN